MKRIRCLLPALLVLTLLGTVHGFQPGNPTLIKNHIVIETEEGKVIIKIQTRSRPEKYSLLRTFFGDSFLSEQIVAGHPAKYDLKCYVYKNIFVIEMDERVFTDVYKNFNWVSLILFKRGGTREEYFYKSDKYILPVEEPNEQERE